MAVSPGTRLGPHEILAPLGAGGRGLNSDEEIRLERAAAS